MTELTRRDTGDAAKWGFFALIAIATLAVIWADERFLVVASDPEWGRIARFKWLLLVHGPLGAVALVLGPLQFSDRLRRAQPRLHRWTGRVYIAAIAISAPVAGYIGAHFEPRSIQVEQYFQSGGWLLSTAIALVMILRRNLPAHKLWMMRSYGFCLVFVTSRVPDAVPGFHWNDQLLSDVLWGLVIAALTGPDLILAAREALRRRRTRG